MNLFVTFKCKLFIKNKEGVSNLSLNGRTRGSKDDEITHKGHLFL